MWVVYKLPSIFCPPFNMYLSLWWSWGPSREVIWWPTIAKTAAWTPHIMTCPQNSICAPSVVPAEWALNRVSTTPFLFSLKFTSASRVELLKIRCVFNYLWESRCNLAMCAVHPQIAQLYPCTSTSVASQASCSFIQSEQCWRPLPHMLVQVKFVKTKVVQRWCCQW